MLFSYKRYSRINSWFNIISSFWLVVVSYIFIISLFIFVLITNNNYFNLNIPIKAIANLFLVGVLVTAIYGIWNSNNPRVTRFEIKSDSLEKYWAGKKIVLVSDIHIGNIRREKFLKKVVDIINRENPDITFNVGDLIEGSSFPYEKWFGPLSELTPFYGNHYAEGNHERYSREYDVFRSHFPKALNDLTDKKTIINETQIIGLGHKEKESGDKTKSRLKSLGYSPEIPSIILIHDPKNIRALSECGVSLVLSGHTHGGQFFPFTVMIDRLYKKYAHGIFYTNNTVSITSYGAGTSIIPVRIGTIPEIVVITIKPDSALGSI
jgi:predicted MPP superfamily phosphohydrolase